jgi:hypothetical protein
MAKIGGDQPPKVDGRTSQRSNMPTTTEHPKKSTEAKRQGFKKTETLVEFENQEN